MAVAAARVAMASVVGEWPAGICRTSPSPGRWPCLRDMMVRAHTQTGKTQRRLSRSRSAILSLDRPRESKLWNPLR
eukprot:3130100-Prymnesium_polylepis.1